MASCIRCGMPPVAGSRYCAECANGRPAQPAPRELPVTPASEEYAAHTDGRIARLEDDVASLRRQLAALADRCAEMLSRRCIHGEPADECAYCDDASEEVKP